MKKILLALIACSILSGCAGELRDEAAEDSNANVLKYVVENQPECRDNSFAHDLYQANSKEMTYRESKGAMNAQDDADAIQAAKLKCAADNAKQAEYNRLQAQYEQQEHQSRYEQDERLERICEAAHPYMMSQCMVNSGINEMVDAL
ncbi:hypothetical protein ACVTW2_000662 [Escherichia coli]